MREQDGCQRRFSVENVRRHVWQPCFVIVVNVVHVRGPTTQRTLNNMVISLDRRLNSVPQQLWPCQKIALSGVVGHPVREGVAKEEKLVVPARLFLLVDATFSQAHDFLFFRWSRLLLPPLVARRLLFFCWGFSGGLGHSTLILHHKIRYKINTGSF